MLEILLRELSNADIDWMVTSGQQKQVAAGAVLLRPGDVPDQVCLLLEGGLSVFAAPNGTETGMSEIAQLLRGDMLGLPTLLDDRPIISRVQAAQDSTVLVLSMPQLKEKLRQDIRFAAHFYKAIAQILSDRVRQMFEMPEKISFAEGQTIKEALFIFGEVQDSDIDWLISAGQVRKLLSDEVLLHAGRPVDALYVILDGLLSISIPEGKYDALSLCFIGLEKRTRSQKVIADMSKGSMPGIISFLDARPLPVTIRATNETLVFAIPRQQMNIKLQQDLGFAARFYRVVALQVSELLYMVMGRLGCDRHTYSQQQGMDEDMEYSDELDLDDLQQMSQGANRFNWMLKRLGVGGSLV